MDQACHPQWDTTGSLPCCPNPALGKLGARLVLEVVRAAGRGIGPRARRFAGVNLTDIRPERGALWRIVAVEAPIVIALWADVEGEWGWWARIPPWNPLDRHAITLARCGDATASMPSGGLVLVRAAQGKLDLANSSDRGITGSDPKRRWTVTSHSAGGVGGPTGLRSTRPSSAVPSATRAMCISSHRQTWTTAPSTTSLLGSNTLDLAAPVLEASGLEAPGHQCPLVRLRIGEPPCGPSADDTDNLCSRRVSACLTNEGGLVERW